MAISKKENCFALHIIELVPLMTNAARSILSNAEDVEDVVQETMIKLLKHGILPSDRASVRKYVYGAALNKARDLLRSTKLEKRYMDRKSDFLDYSLDGYSACAIAEKHSDFDELQSLYTALAALPESHRRPLILSMVGHPYQEIATKLALNVGTVRSRIFYARKRLAELLN